MDALQFFLEDRSPFTRKFYTASSATAPTLLIQLLDNENTAVSFTGSVSCACSMVSEGGTSIFSAQAGTVVDRTDGQFSYQFTAGNLAGATGRNYVQFTITDGSNIYAVPNNSNQRLMVIVSDSI